MMLLREMLKPNWPGSSYKGGPYYPSRTIPFSRLADAWAVFRGRAEAVVFPDQEPAAPGDTREETNG